MLQLAVMSAPCVGATQCIEAGCRRHCVAPLPGLRLLLGYRNYYAIHGSPYMSAHVLIENTLVQYKMAKNSRVAHCVARIKCV